MATSPMKVMLALDDSAHSEYALESVIQRPWPAATEFLVFCVFEPYHPDFAGWDASAIDQAVLYGKRLAEDTSKYAEASAEKLKANIPEVNVIHEAVENARIKETIIQKAIDWQANLIIMGSHGRTGLQRFLLGSVSQAVVAHAPCSVEIIKRPLYHSSN